MTFCVLPWMHLSIDNYGNFRPCCISTTSNYNINDHSFKEYMLSDENKQLRENMLNGVWDEKCERCRFDEEKTGRSKRLYENTRFSTDLNFNVDSYYDPLFLDIRVGNKCNLKCKMCWAGSSNLIAKENGISNSLIELPDATYDVLCGFIQNTQELFVLGGESTVVDGGNRLLDFSIKNGYAKNINYQTYINGTTLPPEFIHNVKQFKSSTIILSIDGYDNVNKYIRWPSNWDNIETNLKKLNALPLNIKISVTIQCLNIPYITDLLDWLEETAPNIEVRFNLLHKPDYYSLYMLPLETRKEIAAKLSKDWDLDLRGRISYLQDMLLVDKPDHPSKHINDFWEHSNKQDALRGCDLKDYLPEVYDILKDIKE